MSDGVIFAVVVVCQYCSSRSGGHGENVAWKTIMILIWFLLKSASGYVCSKEPQSVCGDHPRDVIPGLAGAIVLET